MSHSPARALAAAPPAGLASRAVAWAVLALGAALLAVAAACAAVLAYALVAPPPEPLVPGGPAPGADSAAMGTAFAWIGGLLALALGASAWYLGRRLPGAPARVRPAPE